MTIRSLLLVLFLSSHIFNTSSDIIHTKCNFWNDLVDNDDIGDIYSCDIAQIESSGVVNEILTEHNYEMNNSDVKLFWHVIWENKYLANFDASICERFENLEKILLGYVNIRTIQENSLARCRKLKELKFYWNEFQILPKGLLASNDNLVKLEIIKNRLANFDPEMFKNLKKLEILNIHGNDIENLPSHIFDSLKNLQELNLSNNKFTSINKIWFKNLKNLRILNLNYNQISEINKFHFGNLITLKHLSLNGNGIKSLTSDVFKDLTNLKELYLDENEISELPENIFAVSKNLEYLSMNYNQLTVIHKNSFAEKTEIIKLCLENNMIDKIDRNLIINSKITGISMKNNVCYEDNIESRDEIEEKLRKCFENYIPRMEKGRFTFL